MLRKKSNPNKGGALQMSFLTPECQWELPSMSELPSLKGAKRIALDCETKDVDLVDLGPGSLRGGYTVGWSFAIDGGPKRYLPIRHEGGDNLPVEQVLAYLSHELKHFDGEIVGANIGYDYDYALSDGIQFHPDVIFRDVTIADPLINELEYSFSLKNIGKRMGIESKDESMLIDAARSMGLDPKNGLWRLPGRYVGEYGEKDVTSPLEIFARQEKIIKDRGLQQIFDLESQVTPVLIRMRRRGIRINVDRLNQIELWAEKEEIKALDIIKRETGVQIGFGNIWKPNNIAPALENIGIRLNKTSTGAPQIDKELLASIDHPVADSILRARKVNKIRTTFASSIHRYMINGRIHCTYHQIAKEDDGGAGKGSRYGRLSAVHPNMQQQPSPDKDPEIAGEWRKIYIAEEGCVWGINDYSQQEPRWTTHFAAVMDLPKAKEAAKRYRDDPNVDNHDMMTRLIHTDAVVDKWLAEKSTDYKVNRGYSKNIFLGLCYGEGGPKLCVDIGKPTLWAHIHGWGQNRKTLKFSTQHEAMQSRMEAGKGYIREIAGEEGQQILDQFDEEVPYVRLAAEAASNIAEKRGVVKTILGRQLHFHQRKDGSFENTHKAFNRVIQGSSADQMKKALVDLDRAGVFLQLQVHDESGGSYESPKKVKEAGAIMRDCILEYCTPLVPFRVDSEYGPSWGEPKKVED